MTEEVRDILVYLVKIKGSCWVIAKQTRTCKECPEEVNNLCRQLECKLNQQAGLLYSRDVQWEIKKQYYKAVYDVALGLLLEEYGKDGVTAMLI